MSIFILHRKKDFFRGKLYFILKNSHVWGIIRKAEREDRKDTKPYIRADITIPEHLIIMEKFVKYTASAILFILCGMFIFRCCMVADKSTFDSLDLTDGLASALADGETTVWTVDRVEREISESGYFCAYAFYWIPESSEVQCTVRWNDSAYEYTGMDAGYEYTFHLLNETTGETFPCTAISSEKNSIYNFRKLVSSGVNLTDTERLTVVMELRDGYTDTQIIKFAEQPMKEYKVPKNLK